MSHYCICPICNQKFDRDKIQAVRYGTRRYAHASCDPDNKDFIPLVKTLRDDPNYVDLMNTIDELYKNTAKYAQIQKQLKTFIEEKKYTYSGIKKSLIYFYKIKKNSIEQSNGHLGIIPYIYDEAKLYYLNIYYAQEANKEKKIKTKEKEVTIKPPKKQKIKQKMFNLGGDKESE